jgi:YgiT-type zinc finger domain-containing protein
MLKVKRDIMNYKNYPNSFTCLCGRNASLKIKNIETWYKNDNITVKNVPGYECENNHFKLARITRVKIKELLKKAHSENQNEIDFDQ